MRAILVGRRQVQEKSVNYYLLADEMEDTGENYGIQVEWADGDKERVRGITVSQKQITRLIFLMMESLVTPVTLRDVVEDWLLQ